MKNKKLYLVIVLSLSLSFMFSTKVLASLTFSSAAITGDTASAIDVGAGNALSLQTMNNGAVNIGTGLVTLGGSLSATGAITIGTGGVENGADLTIDKNSTTAAIVAASHGSTVSSIPLIELVRTRGSHASKTAIQNGDELGELQFHGYYDTVGGMAAGIISTATQTWSNVGAGGAKLAFQITPNGTFSNVTTLTLDQDQSATFAGSIVASTNIKLGGGVTFSSTAPTIAAGFGSSHTVEAGSTTASWAVTVTTSGGATTGTLTLPTASHRWTCWATDQTTNAKTTFQSGGSTTTAVFTATAAWLDGDVIIGGCSAH